MDIQNLATAENLTKDDLICLLALNSHDTQSQILYNTAYSVKEKYCGKTVALRGLIEWSNHCGKNCYYCGIRRQNTEVIRYTMQNEEVLSAAAAAWELGYGSIVLQSGEINSAAAIKQITLLLQILHATYGDSLGITLSLGEQKPQTYQQWITAGAHRYLLRIETSSKNLYQSLHPKNHSFDRRVDCLAVLKQLGYQVGTGIMIGLPGQTLEDMADDILFFKKIDADMLGMGPYIPHSQTPLGKQYPASAQMLEQRLHLSLRMIAATRIALKDINIASTTALQALHAQGRELGLKAGANVIMPNLTHVNYKKNYTLYENKPCMDEDSKQCHSCLESRILSIGETIALRQRGDSPHFLKRRNADAAGD